MSAPTARGRRLHPGRRRAKFSVLHGKVVTLNGELSRRPMPRIDQIALKAKRDLTDAFVLLVRKVADDVGSTVVPCAE